MIIPDSADIWPHELESAKALIRYGHTVEFIKATDQKGKQTADCLIDGIAWEMKAPKASSLKTVERNLKRGRWQSCRIIFDSRRMKYVPDKAIERELRKRFNEISDIKEIKFINRHGRVIDISWEFAIINLSKLLHGALVTFRRGFFLCYYLYK